MADTRRPGTQIAISERGDQGPPDARQFKTFLGWRFPSVSCCGGSFC